MNDKIAQATKDMKQNNNFGIHMTIIPAKNPEDSPAYKMTIRKDSPALEAFQTEHRRLVDLAEAVEVHEASRVSGKYYDCPTPSAQKTLMLQHAVIEKRLLETAGTPMYIAI